MILFCPDIKVTTGETVAMNHTRVEFACERKGADSVCDLKMTRQICTYVMRDINRADMQKGPDVLALG